MVSINMKFRNCQTDSDCVRACLATLTDDDDVPHVFDGREAILAWQALRDYLATKGKKLAAFCIDDLQYMAEENEGIPYMLLGKQVFGGLHAVVGMNGKVIHDPAAVKRDLTKHPETQSWIVFLVL
jgi:hypothetical protein